MLTIATSGGECEPRGKPANPGLSGKWPLKYSQLYTHHFNGHSVLIALLSIPSGICAYSLRHSSIKTPWCLSSYVIHSWISKIKIISTSSNSSTVQYCNVAYKEWCYVFCSGVFWLYSGFALVGIILFALCLPETKGKQLEEVEQLFSDPLISFRRCCGGTYNRMSE